MRTPLLLLWIVAVEATALGAPPPLDAPTPAPASQPALALHYEITLRAPAAHRVDVVARITGLAAEGRAVRLTLPEDWAFVRLPEPLLIGPIEATAEGKPLDLERKEPYVWALRPAGRGAVELRYAVPLTFRELDAVRGRHEYEFPFVDDDSGLLATAALVVAPADDPAARIRVLLHVPDGWRVWAPWRVLPGGELEPPSLTALQNDLIAVGRWSAHEFCVGGFVGTVAFAPNQCDIEQPAVDLIRRIVAHELSVFGRPAEGQYLFLFGPPIDRGMAGSPKTNSMILVVDPRMHARGARHLAHLIAHEFFHTWAHTIGELPDELRWLNEGITDYYAYLVSARLGLLTWDEFGKELADRMRSASANRHFGQMSLVDAGGPQFFRDEAAYELVYHGGLLIGAWLDQAVRAGDKDRSLEDLLRALLNDARWKSGDRGPRMEDFAAALPRFVSDTLARRVLAAVREPYRFDPVAAFGELGIAIRKSVEPAKLDLRANLEGTRVIDIDHQDAAYRLGIRADDRFLEVNGMIVSTPTEVYAAWRAPRAGRVRAEIRRGAREVTVDAPVPEEVRYAVPVAAWEVTGSTSAP